MIWKFHHRGLTGTYIYVDLRCVRSIATDESPYEIDMYDHIKIIGGNEPLEVDLIPRDGETADETMQRFLNAWDEARGG